MHTNAYIHTHVTHSCTCTCTCTHTHTVPSQPSCSLSTGQNQEDCLRLEERVKTLTNTSLCALQSQGNIRSHPCEDESPPSVLWEEPGLHPHPSLPNRGHQGADCVAYFMSSGLTGTAPRLGAHRGPPSGQASSPNQTPTSALPHSTPGLKNPCPQGLIQPGPHKRGQPTGFALASSGRI